MLHFNSADRNFYACLSRNGYDGTAGRQQLETAVAAVTRERIVLTLCMNICSASRKSKANYAEEWIV